MSNGVKIGLLVVIAGALGFVAWRQIQAKDGEITSRPADQAQIAQNNMTTNADGTRVQSNSAEQKPADQSGQASQTRAKTTWKFDKSEHDFGKLKQGESAEYKFKFTNTGKEPLIIENAQGSCGCTVPNYPKEPIAPGASGTIDVRFNSAGKNGAQQKTVTLTANTDPSITTILTIKADVEAPAK
jgi:hypothetical protein